MIIASSNEQTHSISRLSRGFANITTWPCQGKSPTRSQLSGSVSLTQPPKLSVVNIPSSPPNRISSRLLRDSISPAESHRTSISRSRETSVKIVTITSFIVILPCCRWVRRPWTHGATRQPPSRPQKLRQRCWVFLSPWSPGLHVEMLVRSPCPRSLELNAPRV